MCVCFVDLEPWDAQTLCKETQIKIKLLAFHGYILRTHRTNALLLITLIWYVSIGFHDFDIGINSIHAIPTPRIYSVFGS
jgi:hypothetical protein